MKRSGYILLATFLTFATIDVKAQSVSAAADIETSIDYLGSHPQSPEDYVMSKFKDHDYVFIGEFHRLKQNLELLQNLIPKLYQAGIFQIGWEFGPYEYQEALDSMLFSDHYDADLVKRSMLEWYPVWSFTEYYDVFRKAWEFNQGLPTDARKFRIVNLNYAPDHRYAGMSKKKRSKYYYKGSTDSHMAKIIFKEFVSKGEKALIYSGLHHSFTKFHQPIVVRGTQYGFTRNRMGNVIYDSIPEKVFHIILHHPWKDKYYEGFRQPFQGILEKIMEGNGNQAIGFDTKNTPLGLLTEDSLSYYAAGYEDFKLETITDGYIFQLPICAYENAQLDIPWVEANWKSIRQKQDPLVKLSLMGGKKKFMKMMIKESSSIHRFPCANR